MAWEPIRKLTTETQNSGAVELDPASSASRVRPRDVIDSADDKPSKRRRKTKMTDGLVHTIKYWWGADMISPEQVVEEALKYDPKLVGIVSAMVEDFLHRQRMNNQTRAGVGKCSEVCIGADAASTDSMEDIQYATICNSQMSPPNVADPTTMGRILPTLEVANDEPQPLSSAALPSGPDEEVQTSSSMIINPLKPPSLGQGTPSAPQGVFESEKGVDGSDQLALSPPVHIQRREVIDLDALEDGFSSDIEDDSIEMSGGPSGDGEGQLLTSTKDTEESEIENEGEREDFSRDPLKEENVPGTPELGPLPDDEMANVEFLDEAGELAERLYFPLSIAFLTLIVVWHR